MTGFFIAVSAIIPRAMGMKYYIKTFGCQMNVADSREYRLALEAYGMTQSMQEFDADLLIVNTCSVRAKAEDKLVSYLGAAQAATKDSPGLKVGLVGCTATLIGEELKRRFPVIKFLLPATEVDSFTEVVLESIPGLTAFSGELSGSIGERERFERYITVMRGCEMFCSYCVVPYARGNVRSLPLTEILRRCDEAVSGGSKVLTLLGQNVMVYGRNPEDPSDTPANFTELLKTVSDRHPDCWIKFLTSHPGDVTRELIDLVGAISNISKHFHLPLQSGDDKVLKDMNRGYTSAQYRELIGYIRGTIPGNRISTDIIAGFPTEDEAAFENTLGLVRELEFDQMFTFQYSHRPGTAALKWEDPVPFEEKRRRLQKLIDIQNEIVLRKHIALEGSRMPAIIYGPAYKSPAKLTAVSRESHVILIPDAGIEPGSTIDVEITKGKQRTLEGRIVG